MRSNQAFLNSRVVPLLVVLAFIFGMIGYSQMSKNNELKDGNRNLASSYPHNAYQAAYEMKSDNDVGVMVVFSDGVGHVRVENNLPNTKNTFTTIYDFPKGEKYFMKEVEKTVMESGMSSLGMGFMDQEMFKSTNAESLGTQMINDRPALGYRSNLLGDGAAQIESWFDKSTGCLMVSKTKGATYTLTRYTSKAPKAYLFEVPRDYKKVPLGF